MTLDLLRTIIAMFAGGVFATYLIIKWRSLTQFTWWIRIVGTLLCSMILFSTSVRTFVYHAGVEVAPSWYAPVNDSLMIALSASVITLIIKSSRRT